MSQELFKIPCVAESAEQARLATFEQHGRLLVSDVLDTLEGVLRLVTQRRLRALENPRLYSDKLDEYDRIERQLYELSDTDDDQAIKTIEALRLAGDSRLADKQRVCAVWVSGSRWIIFGRA